MQRTLIIFKPDCVQRRLVGELLRKFESRGLKIVGLKMLRVGTELAERHYAEHKDKTFFGGLIQFITSGPVIAGVLAGPDAVTIVRGMLGDTNSPIAKPGTIRGDYAMSKQNNLIHASDGPEAAACEIALWFGPEELVEYSIADEIWLGGGGS